MQKEFEQKIWKNFITLEGGEGSGKSTLSKKLKSYLESIGQEVILTREPGGDPTSEKIRQIIFQNDIHPKTEAHLFAAARIEHINNVIIPALQVGKIVICDRYVDSSIVYQCFVGKVKNVYEINEYAYKHCMPSLTFFLDVSPEIALRRLEDNKREKNRFDQREVKFHQQIYDGYLKLSDLESRIIKIDASKSENKILNQVIKYLEY